MRSFFDRKRGKPFLVLDIEDDSVKSLVLRRDGDGLTLMESNSGEYDENHIEESILRVVKSSYGRMPVLLGLPSSIFKAKAVLHYLERDGSKIISRQEESSIIQKVIQDTKNKISQEFMRDYGIMTKDIQWANFKILERKLNGYPVYKLAGFDGEEIEYKVLGTYLPKNDYLKIRSALDELGLKVAKITHIAEALAEVNYPKDLRNIKNLTKGLEKSPYLPTLLMSYYAKEIF